MLSRLLPRSLLRFRTLTLASRIHPRLPSSPPSFPPLHFARPSPYFLLQSLHPFSTHGKDGSGGDGDGTWKLFPESDETVDSVFGEEEGNLSGIVEESGDALRSEAAAPAVRSDAQSGGSWSEELIADRKGDLFEEIERGFRGKVEGAGGDEWETAEGYKLWTLGDDEEKGDVFDIGGVGEETFEGIEGLQEEEKRTDEQRELAVKEQEFMATLKGPNRAFGDLIAASGITEDMIDSLILLKDVRGIEGLPPLSEIEDKAIARMNATSSRAEIERKKQEEIANARVRKVDEKGRAYGTGRRKCGIARVWIQPGDGKFIINDKQFDAYFPMLDQRAELLRPFTATNTLGLWDVNCTVKGGGVSGQVGAIRLGISNALQNWEPGLRPYLKSAGYLTRDARVVERKKPGKAKARKSFQWVKR